MDPALVAVERAMVAIRRSQSRRVLSRHMVIDPAVFGVLDAVEEGGPFSVTELAAVLAVDQPRASRLVAKAVDEGLLRRQADQSDGRRTLVVLTSSGRRQVDAAHENRRRVFAEAMAGWSDAERETFARLLTSFVAGTDTPR
ncbi:MAG: MarR family transcriptional regulator [Kibdelosporangium sp.]